MRPLSCTPCKRFASGLALALALATAAAAGEGPQVPASSGASQPAWHCWYNAPVHVSCVRAAQLPAPARRLLHIPLHAVPIDMQRVAQLAQAIVCGGQPACEMRFGPPAWAVLDAVLDPVLASAGD